MSVVLVLCVLAMGFYNKILPVVSTAGYSMEYQDKLFNTDNIIDIDINSDIDNALKTMGSNKIKRLLVKEKDNIVGILSLSDILNYTSDNNLIDTYKSIFYIHNNQNKFTPKVDDFYL